METSAWGVAGRPGAATSAPWMARARLRTEPAPAKAGDVLRREKRLPAARTRRPAGTCASDSSCAPWMDEEPKKEGTVSGALFDNRRSRSEEHTSEIQ